MGVIALPYMAPAELVKRACRKFLLHSITLFKVHGLMQWCWVYIICHYLFFSFVQCLQNIFGPHESLFMHFVLFDCVQSVLLSNDLAPSINML